MKDLSLSTYFLLMISYTLMGYATASYAARKNKNKSTWFFLGFLFGILALLALFLLPKREEKSSLPPRVEPIAPSSTPYSSCLWYYIDEANSQNGPMSFEAFKKAYQSFKLKKDYYVWSELFPDWVVLATQSELLQIIE